MLRKPRPPKADRSEEFASHKPPEPAALWRHDGKARATVPVPVPKDAPVEHEGYRRLVAAMPCIKCGMHGKSQAAHGPTLGRGIKADDRTCFPLCTVAGNGCHERFDQYLMYGKRQRRDKARQWGAEVREQIKAAGAWPASLPEWPLDAHEAASEPAQERSGAKGGEGT